MKPYRRIVVQLACATLLLAASAPGQDLFVADYGNGNIVQITTNGTQTTFASEYGPSVLAFDSAGNLFVGNFSENNIYEFECTEGVLSTNATPFAFGLNWPNGLAFDSAGNLFEADAGTNTINEFININGVLSTNPTPFATRSNPSGLAFDSAGNLFESDNGVINEFINNNGVLSTTPTPFASQLNVPIGLAFDSVGNLFEADYGSGNIYEFVKEGGVLSANPTVFVSGLQGPWGLTFDSAGDLFVADAISSNIYEFVRTSGFLSTNRTLFASGLGRPQGLAFFVPPAPAPPSSVAGNQNLFETDQNDMTTVTNLNEFVSQNGMLSSKPIGFASCVNNPGALAFDSTGDLFVVNLWPCNIYEFINNNSVLSTNATTVAGSGVLENPMALAIDSKGDLFIADGMLSGILGNIYEFSNSNGVLSSTPILFASGVSNPVALAFDSAGDLFEADGGYFTNTFSSTIGILTPGAINEFTYTNGVLSSSPIVFATVLGANALSFDSAGDLFEPELGGCYCIHEYPNNNGVLSRSPSVFATGVYPMGGLAFDSAGDLFETDAGAILPLSTSEGRINEFIKHNGVLSSTPIVFARMSYPTLQWEPGALAFSPSPTQLPAGRLTVKKFQAKVNLNPARENADTCSLTAVPALPSGFRMANQTVTVDVGDAEATFTLNAKASSKTSTNSCKFSYAKKTGVWTLTVSMKKGSWAEPWADYGVTNATTPKAGLWLKMPVTVTIGTNGFGTEDSVLYKATAGKSGTLK